jgi:hypothetical protein
MAKFALKICLCILQQTIGTGLDKLLNLAELDGTQDCMKISTPIVI